ncbi:hypothetical protein SAMN05444157_1346 [Frankineae bacterium MT45]|nr:hypothetical protein SAMN05444157_1346 [Frankineae bacterium MT45]
MSEAPGESIVDVFESDARGITALAVSLAETTDRFDDEVETAQLVREIVESQAAAELTLHPLIRRHLPAGDAVAEEQFHTHRQMETCLRRLESADVTSTEFRAILGEVRDRWLANAAHLATEVYPALRANCSSSELRQAGEAALVAEYRGPTRPRHLAVETPGVDTLISFSEGFVDKTIDAFTHRGHAGTEEIHERLRSGRYDNLEAD